MLNTINQFQKLQKSLFEQGMIKQASQLKLASYEIKQVLSDYGEGVQGYAIKNSRCFGRCYREKRNEKPEMTAQDVWFECLSEYQADANRLKGSDFAKYASGQNLVKTAQNKINEGFDPGFAIFDSIEELSKNFKDSHENKVLAQTEKLLKIASSLKEQGKIAQATKLAEMTDEVIKEAGFFSQAGIKDIFNALQGKGKAFQDTIKSITVPIQEIKNKIANPKAVGSVAYSVNKLNGYFKFLQQIIKSNNPQQKQRALLLIKDLVKNYKNAYNSAKDAKALLKNVWQIVGSVTNNGMFSRKTLQTFYNEVMVLNGSLNSVGKLLQQEQKNINMIEQFLKKQQSNPNVYQNKSAGNIFEQNIFKYSQMNTGTINVPNFASPSKAKGNFTPSSKNSPTQVSQVGNIPVQQVTTLSTAIADSFGTLQQLNQTVGNLYKSVQNFENKVKTYIPQEKQISQKQVQQQKDQQTQKTPQISKQQQKQVNEIYKDFMSSIKSLSGEYQLKAIKDFLADSEYAVMSRNPGIQKVLASSEEIVKTAQFMASTLSSSTDDELTKYQVAKMLGQYLKKTFNGTTWVGKQVAQKQKVEDTKTQQFDKDEIFKKNFLRAGASIAHYYKDYNVAQSDPLQGIAYAYTVTIGHALAARYQFKTNGFYYQLTNRNHMQEVWVVKQGKKIRTHAPQRHPQQKAWVPLDMTKELYQTMGDGRMGSNPLDKQIQKSRNFLQSYYKQQQAQQPQQSPIQ